MKRFMVHTIEHVWRSYWVTAETADEAKIKFEAGDFDRDSGPSETLDCEIVDVDEVEA